MSVLKVLRDRVAPELNHLYTEVPRERSGGGLDCGWHAREHALHACLVARLFGTSATLCSGDFGLLSRLLPALSSIGTDADHSWCEIGGVVPVDLGMTFRHFAECPQLRTPITGVGRNGAWQVRYASDESVLDEAMETGNEILYLERRVHEAAPGDLLDNPHLFLGLPRAGEPVATPDAYAQITLHCFCCAAGEAKSIRHRFDAERARAWIGENYPDAAARIRERLAFHAS